MGYDPLGLDQATGGGGGNGPYDPLNLGQEEKKPSYLEAAKVGLKESLYGGLRKFEAPFRPLARAMGIPPGLEASESFKPSPEEEQRTSQLGIPGQIVKGVAGAPATIASYAPFIAAGGPVGGFVLPEAMEMGADTLEGKGPGAGEAARRIGESAAMGLGFKYLPPSLRSRIPAMAGMFGGQAFTEALAGGSGLAEAGKQAIAPAVIGAGMGFLGREKPQIDPRSGSYPLASEFPGEPGPPHPYYAGRPSPGGPYPLVPYQKPGLPVDTGNYFQEGRMRPVGPEPPEPQQLPYVRGLPRPGEEHYGSITPPEPTPDWVKEGRDWPPPKYPPAAYDPLDLLHTKLTGPKVSDYLRSEAPKTPETPPMTEPTHLGEKATQALKNSLSDSQMEAVTRNASNLGYASIDLVKRWAGIGTKRADQALNAMKESGLVEPSNDAMMPWKYVGAKPEEGPGITSRYAGEIRELEDIIKRGAPGKKMGDESGETKAWGTSQGIEGMLGKPYTRRDVLEAFERGLKGDDFPEKTRNVKGKAVVIKREQELKEIWGAIKKQARGIYKDRIDQMRDEKQRAIINDDPEWTKPETFDSLTRVKDDEIIGIKEELREQGYSEKEIGRRVDEIGKRVEAEETPPDVEEIKKQLTEELAPAKPEPIKPPDVEGVKYEGVQDLSKIGEPNQHVFTDEETKSSFSTADISKENLIAKRDAMRENFRKAKEPQGAPSPTRKGETLLPGLKVGLEMAGAKAGGGPTLEGSPLMQAAHKAEVDAVQPKLFGREAELAAPKPPEGLVKFNIPGLNGPKTVAGTVKRILPDGKFEVKTQQDGYQVIDQSEIDRTSPKPAEKPSPQFGIGDKVKSGDFKGVVAEINEDGSILIGAKDGKMIQVEAGKVEADIPGRLPAVMADGDVLIGSGTHGSIPPERYSEAKEVKIGWVDTEGNFTESKASEPAPEPPPVDLAKPEEALRKLVEAKGIDFDTLNAKQKEKWQKELDGVKSDPAEKMGIAYVKDQQRYFTNSEEITKGKDKGKVRVTLTDGKKIVIAKENIKRAKAEFNLGEAPKEPLQQEAVQGFADERLRLLKNAPETEIVDTFEDIPDRIKGQLEENVRQGIKGVYDPLSKKVFLVRDMMGSESDVIGTIEHEAVGHYATEAYLGKDAEPFFNRVYLRFGRAGLKDIAEERGFDLNTREGRISAAKEKFAQLVEDGKDPGLLKQFYAWVREQIAKVFPDMKLSDAEIERTISKARDFLASGGEERAKVEGLKSQMAAQFSILSKTKEAGRASYEEEIKPKAKGFVEGWQWFKKLVVPTSGVDVKDMDTMMKFLGDREMAKARLEIMTEKGISEINKLSPTEQIDLVDKIQMGTKINELPENLREYARLHREIEDALWMKANDVLSDSDPAARIAYLEGHVRNMWKVVPKNLEEDIQKKGFEGLWRRPIEGSRSALHEQYYTLKSGMENGGVPFTTNLLDLTRLNHEDTMKLLTAHEMWNGIRDIGHRKFVKFGEQIPEGFRPLNDRIANKYFPPKEAGRWVVEDNVGRLLENYLSRDYVRENPLLKSVMGIKNVTTALELGFSAFHASFEAWESIASQVGLGMRKAWNQGQIAAGLKDILGAPIAPYKLWRTGKDISRLFKNPEEFMASTGGQKFMKSFPEAKEMIGDLFWGGGSVRMNEAYRINSINAFKENLNSKNYIGAALRSIPALSQTMMKPLFENYIPALKRATFFREFANELQARQADLTIGKITRPELARNVWSFVENRFGEMSFDNLWWNRTMKSGLQMAVRSVTWKLGNIRSYGKAVTGQSSELMAAMREGRMPKLTQEMAWVWGLGAVTAAMAGIAQYAFTGKHPEGWKDLVYPQIDKQGGRISLPTYMRDLFSATHAPVKYVTSSMAGWVGRFTDILNNKDFYGTQIHDPNENVIMQRVDDLIHLAPLPFSIQSMQRMRQEGETASRQVMGFLGATKAPYWIERTDAEQKASELKAAHLPIGGRSAEDFQRGQLLKNYAKQYQAATLKNESTEQIMTQIHSDIASGKLRMQDLLNFRQRVTHEPLTAAVMHLQFKDILEVWNVASGDEKKKLLPILSRKFQGLRSPEDRIRYLQKMKEIQEEARSAG